VREVTIQPAASSQRPLAWDALLAIGLLVTTMVIAMVLMSTLILLPPKLEGPFAVPLMAGAVIAGCFTSRRLLRNWLSAMAHHRAALLASSLMGCAGLFLSGLALAPWPDLLSDEVLKSGPSMFFAEWAKTFVPWAVGSAAAFAVLRLDPPFRAASQH